MHNAMPMTVAMMPMTSPASGVLNSETISLPYAMYP